MTTSRWRGWLATGLVAWAAGAHGAVADARQLCAIVIDWDVNRPRVLDITRDLEGNGKPAAYLLLDTSRSNQQYDVDSTADVVFSAHPALVVIHLSSFYSATEGRDNKLFGRFFRRVELAGRKAATPYSPSYVIYTRAAIDDGDIAFWSGLVTGSFEDRTEIARLGVNDVTAAVLDKVSLFDDLACP